jgi:hypothetical protein
MEVSYKYSRDQNTGSGARPAAAPFPKKDRSGTHWAFLIC